MNYNDSNNLRQKFLEFFRKHGHTIVQSSSLLPTDPSVLFTTAGMQQFKPYYLGEKSPYGKNAASCQKCIRTSDIEEVGDEKHLTFFEMLGNFSFGGYFKDEAIKLAYDFIVKEMGLEIDYVTVFSPNKVAEGDWRKDVPEDKQSFEIWKKIGVPENKIKKEGIDNFWGPTGDEGPCGPTTEIYVNGIEVWNIVFNEFFCDKNKNLKKLDSAGVDTGMGLERLAAVVQKVPTIFETDLFGPIMKLFPDFVNDKTKRVIADHAKASAFLISDGVIPSNKEQGYILRRLLRRIAVKVRSFGNDVFTPIVRSMEIYRDIYKFDEKRVLSIVKDEVERFNKTLEKGLKEIERTPNLTGEKAFSIYETYGVPLEVAEEIKPVENRQDFFDRLKKHQELSRTASAGMFKGGLADASEQTIKLHTAAHLMLAGLRKVLGGPNGYPVIQKGSNITPERLRFDFSHKEKMTPEQIKEVEDFVNEAINKKLPVKFEEMTLEQARKMNSTGVFESKYGERVKVYTIGEGNDIISIEICGGPHVNNTAELGKFKIIKEESSSGGVRRIKAILE